MSQKYVPEDHCQRLSGENSDRYFIRHQMKGFLSTLLHNMGHVQIIPEIKYELSMIG